MSVGRAFYRYQTMIRYFNLNKHGLKLNIPKLPTQEIANKA